MHKSLVKLPLADHRAGAESPKQECDAIFTDTGRLVALCDGVFAIIITLLVLEIHRPGGEPGSLAQDFKGMAILYRLLCGVSLCRRDLAQPSLSV
jgi:hypothetical protein